MAEKVYCIVKRNGNYYIPVKARLNPYPGHGWEEAYLACLPNFFGGRVERGECHYLGLAREVKEESQGKVNIDMQCLRASNVQLLYKWDNENRGQRGQRGQNVCYYRFYLVTVTEEGDYFDENCFALDMQNHLDPAEREMSCILKIPVDDLVGKDINGFLNICKELGGDWVNFDRSNPNDENNLALTQWRAHEGTKDAFAKLLNLGQ